MGFFKKVRWATTKTVVEPPTPALTMGSFSPASSAGPITPPQYPYQLPPASHPGSMPYGYQKPHNAYAYQSPQPSRSPFIRRLRSYTMPSAPKVQVHRYLEGPRGHPRIQYDVRDRPSSALHNQYYIPHHTLEEPATNPPMGFFTVKSDLVPWQIGIRATSNGRYVTLRDVLEQLHGTLHSHLSRHEFEMLAYNERNLAVKAYQQRYRRLRDAREYEREKAGGMRRVDLLYGNTRLIGLSRTKAPDVWILNTG